MTPFQALLVIKSVQPDRLQNACIAYVCQVWIKCGIWHTSIQAEAGLPISGLKSIATSPKLTPPPQALNIKSIAPPAAGVKVLMENGEATCEQPVLFITTPGADPSQV